MALLSLKSQNCRKNLFIDSPFFYLREGMPVLTADDGAFNNILILGLDHCKKINIQKVSTKYYGGSRKA